MQMKKNKKTTVSALGTLVTSRRWPNGMRHATRLITKDTITEEPEPALDLITFAKEHARNTQGGGDLCSAANATQSPARGFRHVQDLITKDAFKTAISSAWVPTLNTATLKARSPPCTTKAPFGHWPADAAEDLAISFTA